MFEKIPQPTRMIYLREASECDRLILAFCEDEVSISNRTVLTGNGVGKIIFITWIPPIPTNLSFKFNRLQFPVRFALWIIMNESQWQPIKHCGVDFVCACFSLLFHKNCLTLVPGGETKIVICIY